MTVGSVLAIVLAIFVPYAFIAIIISAFFERYSAAANFFDHDSDVERFAVCVWPAALIYIGLVAMHRRIATGSGKGEQ